MLIDMHAHSSGISRCCLIPAEKVVEEAKSAGIDGIILTNHYIFYYAKEGEYGDLAKRYVEEYEHAKKCGERIGCKVFFGIEVTMKYDSKVHLLIYGVRPDFILKHSEIFSYSLEKLYSEVKKDGGIVCQAHPFRGNDNKVQDLNFLDAIEINSHPLYEGTHAEEIIKIATEGGVMVTSGGDFHADTHRPKCGVYFPDDLKDCIELSNWLKEQTQIKLCMQEVDETVSKDLVFHRGEK